VVITGLSGSGKSSLAFDTIYSEGQRRYVESLSAYARQFLGLMKKPDVDYIEGLSPAISIDQKSTSRNPRSTVGTVTEIHDYLRLLYARIGVPHCPECGKRIEQQSPEQIANRILELGRGTRVQILSPVIRDRKGEHRRLLEKLAREGFVRVVVDGEVHELDGQILLDKNKRHSIEVVVDRVVVKPGIKTRLVDSIETALAFAEGVVSIEADSEKMLFSEHFACEECGINLEELTPRMFSFNSPHGACKECQGLGVKMEIDPDLVIPDKRKSILEGAIAPYGSSNDFYLQKLGSVAAHYGFELSTPVISLEKAQIDVILHGSGDEKIRYTHRSRDGTGIWEYEGVYEGVIENLRRRYRETKSSYIQREIEDYMSISPCPSCGGARLCPESLAVTVGGKSIADLTGMSVEELAIFFENIKLKERDALISMQILKEIKERLGFLINVGLEYITLDRATGTLSAGEAQRIRLATQIGSGLVGVLYILDEPSIGLHQRDNVRLIATLEKLRDLGNTVLVVEHDEATIMSADHVIDMGPGAGERGGYVVAAGSPQELIDDENSLTGRYLARKLRIEVPSMRRHPNGLFLTIKGARQHNLKNIDVKIPLGIFTCITGVSGSGKSTLINDTLYPALAQILYGSKLKPGMHEDILGVENIDKVIAIDQSPLGRTPRSNPATYTGIFTPIRELFSRLPESRKRGYKPGRFSFNIKGGRCEACHGDGVIKIEMHFLPDVYVPCELCKGKRYNHETLQVTYRGKNISDVLDMTVDEALNFFQNIPQIKKKLQTLFDVGLGYIKLGQPATTLSGGEAQRVKLSKELSRGSTGSTLYILDEPTTGLHFADIQKLLDVLSRLTDAGNTVVVIEHNMDVIKTADYIIDLGPEGGDKGGTVVACGPPEEIMQVPESYTGQFLKGVLGS
jgi:excinuclease ABC subunit A